MSANVDKVVKIYRSLSLVPSLVGAKLINNQSVVHSVWSQRNLERGENTKFVRTIGISPNLSKKYESLPFDITNEQLSTISPSEKYKAVLRTSNDKQFIEVWQNQNLTKIVDLNALDIHGDVYTDGEFRSFEWSPDETKLLYIAELKIPKSEPFYKRCAKKPKSDDSPKAPKGEEFLYRQDWGEQLVGKKRSVIAEYHLEKDEVEILSGLPEDVCPAQVGYSPDGAFVVGVAYKTEPRKLGLIYCTNRPSTIFTLDFAGNYVPFPLNNKAVKCPIFTPDGKNLIWLQRDAGGPHHSAMALMKAPLPLDSKMVPTAVLDFVKTEIRTDNDRNFYGLYNNGFIKRCFASGNRLVVSTNQKNTINTYVIDIDSGKITELIYEDGSQIVLDVCNDVILVSRRNYLMQDKLAICKLPPKESEVPLNWTELTTSSTPEGLENCIYEYLDLVQDGSDSVKTFSAIYLGPKTAPAKSVNLVVWPHGGPHSAFANNFSLESSLFLSLGFGIVFVNYRGSIGAGQDSVNFLPGKIGQSDVSDCILATQTALQKYAWLNPGGVVLFGGSHGGFLVTYLSGKYPDMFKAVVARNPVIDVASMSIISDIPDWCYVEVGFEYTQVGKPSQDALLAMRKASPIEHAHNVKAPTMLQVGCKDLRVPPHQSLEYYHRLKANGVKIKMNLYEDNHPLAQIPNEMDNLINSLLWFQEHL
ncbi:acylamino-acid-releasing enzyme [Tribolium castaneum]|uniref:acylaminoacyl-peptidase n=1 Tax=Tribolium castaneum TaxID=7070 RepID=D6X1Y3_TRICA|nr:PREDICTED: acylamino-acid-releasing enzyme [Tribolium castaneum]XP_015838711.1 PREDICTED: acylamino-acid-releasing enzyme [Tribolium castaneum]XP_015838712.1 PREDICTED: acylamino-acid-releasing enzyme [Tribolium castaneum]EFA09948.1 Acylamino-acid-releasing enzyme-like Protein [Tribolium castaneum]|eukprot:XP_008197729.1 PREDICTED: acylamino-acid-releasing enzyme [Tribolium castaneum]